MGSSYVIHVVGKPIEAMSSDGTEARGLSRRTVRRFLCAVPDASSRHLNCVRLTGCQTPGKSFTLRPENAFSIYNSLLLLCEWIFHWCTQSERVDRSEKSHRPVEMRGN